MWNIVGGRVCSGIAPAKGYKWHFKDKTLALLNNVKCNYKGAPYGFYATL
jgi:hypothetical protein